MEPAADPQLESLRRNARLRAWRALGLRLEGGWARSPFGYRLRLRCPACALDASWTLSELSPPEFIASQLGPEERRAVARLRERGCEHLAPLLERDPPELCAIAELELLAG